MKSFLKYLLASVLGVLIGGILFLIILIPAGTSFLMSGFKEKPKVHDETVLRLRLTSELPDHTQTLPLLPGLEPGFVTHEGLYEILRALDHARTDDRVKGIWIDMDMDAPGMASLEELREGLKKFKASGKFIVAYGQFVGQKSYYLATVADSVYMAPTGMLLLKGFAARTLHFKRALDQLGIRFQVFYHGKYKSATEPLRLNHMSRANKEQLRAFLQSVYDLFISNIGGDRGVSPEKLDSIVNAFAARTPARAVALGLVDRLLYEDQVKDRVRQLAGLDSSEGRVRFMAMDKYVVATREEPDYSIRDKVALVFMEGDVMNGKSLPENIGADTYVKLFDDLARDSFCRAVVIRMNSPGGDAIASDRMWRAVKVLAAKKPVVVSMGNLAASAGYQISAPADLILAQPNTLTGSIGIFGLWPDLGDFMRDKLNIDFDTVTVGRHADLFNPYRSLTEEESGFFRENIDAGYVDFLQKVAEGRHMDTAAVHAIAQGRIWAGQQAVDIGLVDRIGGMADALQAAGDMAGLDTFRVSVYPKVKSPLEMIMSMFESYGLSPAFRDLADLYKVWKQWQSVARWQGLQERLPYDLVIE